MNQFGQVSGVARMTDYTRKLVAGVSQDINVVGDYWQLIETPSGRITIQLDESVRLMRQAPCGGPGSYRRVTITSDIDQTVVLSLGITNGLVPYDNRSVVAGVLVAVQKIPALLNPIDDIVITAGSTATIPANLLRDTILLTLDDAAPDYVRVVSPTATSGARLYPGGSMPVCSTAAIIIRNPNAVSVTISASEAANP